jgi:pyridoxine 5-phosphate synthase
MRKKLGVNIDHVATLREARKEVYPDPLHAAMLAESGGADQITCHLREDRRHIQERDLKLLRHTAQVPVNLEMASTKEMVRIAMELKPDCVTFVPEKREELTTEGGLDVVSVMEQLQREIDLLREANITVSLFIDPDIEQVRAAHRLNVEAVELHSGRYCDLYGKPGCQAELDRLGDAVKMASRLKLEVRCGHGIDYHNIYPLLEFNEIVEFNIGHSIVARAVMVGMERAVNEMRRILD